MSILIIVSDTLKQIISDTNPNEWKFHSNVLQLPSAEYTFYEGLVQGILLRHQRACITNRNQSA